MHFETSIVKNDDFSLKTEVQICKYKIFVVPLHAFFGFGLRKSPKAAYEKTPISDERQKVFSSV